MIIQFSTEMDFVLRVPREEHSSVDFLMTHTGLLMYRTITLFFAWDSNSSWGYLLNIHNAVIRCPLTCQCPQ